MIILLFAIISDGGISYGVSQSTRFIGAFNTMEEAQLAKEDAIKSITSEVCFMDSDVIIFKTKEVEQGKVYGTNEDTISSAFYIE